LGGKLFKSPVVVNASLFLLVLVLVLVIEGFRVICCSPFVHRNHLRTRSEERIRIKKEGMTGTNRASNIVSARGLKTAFDKKAVLTESLFHA